MRTTGDCFIELWRHIQAGEPVAGDKIEALVDESIALGGRFTVAAKPLDLGRYQVLTVCSQDFGRGWFAETGSIMPGDVKNLIYPN